MQSWEENSTYLNDLLRNLQGTDGSGKDLGAEGTFLQLKKLTIALQQHRRTVFLVGNGASASMASHLSADLAKNARLHTEVFTDLSLITAISNDMGYENVFSEPFRRRAMEGDMLVAISSSGASPNILRCVDVAEKLCVDVVTLSAFNSNNPLRSRGCLNIYVAANSYGAAETCHAAILHYWMDSVAHALNSKIDSLQ